MTTTSTTSSVGAEPAVSESAGGPRGRVYRGRSLDELIPRIQSELGRDAIVLRQRTGLAGGVGGFFQRQFVEIEATPGRPSIDLHDGDDAMPDPMPDPMPDAMSDPMPDAPFAVQTFASALARAETHANAVVEHGVIETDPLAEDEVVEADPLAEDGVVETDRTARGRARARVEQALLDTGIGERFASALIDDARAHAIAFTPRGSLAQAVRKVLEQRIPVLPPLRAQGAAVVLVGPGGSGKTAACAALLEAYRKGGALPASCATVIAGGERDGPELLLGPRISSPVPASAARATKALADARDAGMAIVDTTALSCSDRGAIRQLAGLLRRIEPERIMVALPATLGAKAARQLLEALRPLNANAAVITHADETDQLGVTVEAACAFGLAPEYLFAGGRDRAKLTRVDPPFLASRLMR